MADPRALREVMTDRELDLVSRGMERIMRSIVCSELDGGAQTRADAAHLRRAVLDATGLRKRVPGEWETPRRPTGEECSTNAVVHETESKIGRAIFYPQMGGYAGRAVAVIDREWSENSETGAAVGGCVDVYVWHDGEFPFSDDGSELGERPRVVHHCDPDQFVDFGTKLREWLSECRREMEE